MTSSAPPVPTKILLFGGTGLIGTYILDALVQAHAQQGKFEKIGIFTSAGTAERKKESIEALKTKGVEVIVGDVNIEEDVRRVYESYDTVVSALGRTVILSQIPLLALAEASPTIHTFYPSEYGTDIEYAPSSATEKPHQHKLQVRKYIHEHVTKLHITYLVTGPYSDLYIGGMPPTAVNAGSFDARARKAVLLGTGDELVSFTTMRDVGKLLVTALGTPAAERVRTLKVNSFTKTPREILEEYERQTGARWEVSYTPLEELRRLEEKAWEEGSPLATAYTLRRIWTEGGTLYEKRDNGKIGEPLMESLEEQVRTALRKIRVEL